MHWQADSYPLRYQVSPGSPFCTDCLIANIILMMVMIIIATTLIIAVNMHSSDSQQGEISYPPADIWQCMETFFCCHNLEEGFLLASSE